MKNEIEQLLRNLFAEGYESGFQDAQKGTRPTKTSGPAFSKIMEALDSYAQHELKRFMVEHLSQPTSNQDWCFSMDLGGATESGFAWVEYGFDYNKREPIMTSEGKDLQSLFDRVNFKIGDPESSRWVAVGELG